MSNFNKCHNFAAVIFFFGTPLNKYETQKSLESVLYYLIKLTNNIST